VNDPFQPSVEPAQRYLAEPFFSSIDFMRQELTRVPITQAMGLDIVHFDGDCLQLCAPLTPNINDKQTAFGGSLVSMALITGWTWLVLQMQQHHCVEADVVIAECQNRFLRPVRSDYFSELAFRKGREGDMSAAWDRFHHIYQRKGRARLILDVQLYDQDLKPVMMLQGRYAATRRQRSE